MGVGSRSCVQRSAPETPVRRAAAPCASAPASRPEGPRGRAHLAGRPLELRSPPRSCLRAPAAFHACLPRRIGGPACVASVPSWPGVRGAGSGFAMAVRRDSVWKYCWGVLMVLC
ncbi:uncharacterized protein LOC144579414 [Callithrix jacchus]